MSDQSKTDKEREYSELCAFVLAMAAYRDETVSAPYEMAATLRESLSRLASQSLSTRLSGMRMATRDMLEMTRDLSRAKTRAINRRLKKQSVVTLSDMRGRHWKLVPKILARRRIRNDEEYHLVIERLNDVSSSGFHRTDREKANTMVRGYEGKKGKNTPRRAG